MNINFISIYRLVFLFGLVAALAACGGSNSNDMEPEAETQLQTSVDKMALAEWVGETVVTEPENLDPENLNEELLDLEVSGDAFDHLF